MPAYADAPDAAVMPGTMAKSMWCLAKMSHSSAALAKMAGSPPFSRTMFLPVSATSTIN